MNPTQLIGIALVVAGGLGLAYGSFSYTKDTHQAKLGPLELKVQERETINIPVWAGGGAIVAGAVLLVLGTRKS
jgi:drug/metabolite transporter (DMT)-like permease